MTITNIRHDQCPNVYRMSKDNMLVSSNRFDLPPNEVFMFYAACFKTKAQRFLEPVYGISDSTISAMFRRILQRLTRDYVKTQMDQYWTREKVIA